MTEDQPLPSIKNWFTVGGVTWHYVANEDSFDLWSMQDDVSVANIAAASRKLRSLHPVKGSRIRVRTIPAPYQVLEQPMTWHDMRPKYDGTLKRALLLLGTNAADRETGGMPSEYRGWMWYARHVAQRFLCNERSADTVLGNLAEEVIMGTSSVAFSMRHGHASLPFCMAVALSGLRERLPKRKNGDDFPPCPICGDSNPLPIRYGFPLSDTFEAAERGEVVLGGCCIDLFSPQWECRSCHHRF